MLIVELINLWTSVPKFLQKRMAKSKTSAFPTHGVLGVPAKRAWFVILSVQVWMKIIEQTNCRN